MRYRRPGRECTTSDTIEPHSFEILHNDRATSSSAGI